MLRTAALLPFEVFQLSLPRYTCHAAVCTPPSRRYLSSSASALKSVAAVKYHIGYSFVGKPSFEDPDESNDSSDDKQPNQPRKKAPARSKPSRSSRILQGFPADSPITKWRDSLLQGVGHDLGAGHDFLLNRRCGERSVVGVADGVGGWEESGVDPSVFAQALCWYAHEACEKLEHPADVLDLAYSRVLADKDVVAGSSTACLVSLDDTNGKMIAANLGDSTFLVLRDGKVIHYQPSQTHFFNAPRQLTKLPKGMSGEGSLMDQPGDADVYETTLQPGDLVFLATDGFSDNVWPKELEQLVVLAADHARLKKLDDQAAVDNLARVAVNWARICSFKVDKHSPFEAEARRYGQNLPGGKVDDVTVVAVSVSKAD